MILKNCSLDEFLNIVHGKKVYCFGASAMPKEICEEYEELQFEKLVYCFVDNSQEKCREKYVLNNKAFDVISPDKMADDICDDDIVLITSRFYADMLEQLESYSKLSKINCYIWPAIAPQYKTDYDLKNKINKMELESYQIPKVIHYCWFGNGKIPELEQKCMDTWKSICPDYEIKLWNESNYDIEKNRYMKEAYEAKKWGFVPDYARLDIIYEHGGIYLDTDVEIVKKFDELLKLPGFMGFESKKLVALGLGFGANKGNSLIKKMRDDYDRRSFIKEDGSCDLTASPFIQTKLLEEYGLQLNNKLQQIKDMVILPAECLCPDNNMFPHITENTFSVHKFSGSWTSEAEKKMLQKMRALAT